MMIILGFLNFATAPQIRGLWSAGGEHLWSAAPSVCPHVQRGFKAPALCFARRLRAFRALKQSHIGLARYGGTDMMSP
jgi:hypothetical protein